MSETRDELERMMRDVELQNLRAIFDPERKIEFDEDLLRLAGLVEDESHPSE